MKKIIITGASSGIGKATAEKILNQSEPVEMWLISRRIDSLLSIKESYSSTAHIIHCSKVDVRSKAEVIQWATEVSTIWDSCQVLVNNAGLALGAHNFAESDNEDWDTMIDTNVKGLLYVTQSILPLLIASNSTKHIVNLGSTAGKMVYENGHVYCATKFAVDAISQSLRIDLLEHGVKVTNINPGMVDTNFSLVRYKGDSAKAQNVYDGYEILSPKDVAEVIYFSIMLPPHVNINDLTLTCLQQANSVYKCKSK